MNATLHSAPLGRGKTDAMLALLREGASARADMPRVWVLLATRRQALDYRHRLMTAPETRAVYCNIEFFNFYTLNARLLKRAGKPVRQLNGLARDSLLRHLLRRMADAGELAYFQRIAATRGFVNIMADLIDELKQSRIDPRGFAAAARSAKDRDIAAIYRRYQALLRRGDLVDLEGEGWLALANLARRPEIVADVDLLLVDGYDQFTPVQAATLAALSRGVQAMHITLTAPTDDEREGPHARSRVARRRLEEAFAGAGIRLKQQQLALEEADRHPDLTRLAQGLIGDGAAASDAEALRLIAMPDPAEETRAVLRAVKAQLLQGIAPDDILIALRDWDRYAAHFEAGRAAYGLPLLLHHQPAYAETPVIAAFIDLLSLPPRFRRRDLLDVLRSPYFAVGLDEAAIDLLERISHEQQCLAGAKADWLAIIKRARAPAGRRDDDDQPTRLTRKQAQGLTQGLSAFIDAVTPPERGAAPDFARWLTGLLGPDPRESTPREDEAAGEAADYSLEIIKRAWGDDRLDPAIITRDISALDGLRVILSEMLASHDALTATLNVPAEITWSQFRADLIHALESSGGSPFRTPRSGQALVTTATEARGLPHAHVYIPGLAEGVFPAELAEDPIYLDSEREALQARGIRLATRAERVDEPGLFAELVSLAGRSLTISRPLVQAGKPWRASRIWEAVTRVFPDLPVASRAVGAAITPDQAANPTELMLAVADGLADGDPTKGAAALRARRWLRERGDYRAAWRRVEQGRDVEFGRLRGARFDRYSGVLSHPALLDEVARQLGDERIWSATQLKDYGVCGFRFFAKYLLQLEAAVDPLQGARPIELGAMQHKILEETYRKIRSRGLAIHADNQQAALETLADVAGDILAEAPERFGFRAASTWPQEAQLHLRRLENLVKRDFSPESPLDAFGGPRIVLRQEDFNEDVLLRLAEGMKPLRINAKIDRVDYADGKLIVVDYKSGSRPINRREMEAGRDFQMMLYLAALRSEFEDIGAEEEVAGGLFWHIRSLAASGVMRSGDEDDKAAVDLARAHIARNLRQGRAGQFPVQPSELENGKCVRYCEFSHLCRRSVTEADKNLAPTGS